MNKSSLVGLSIVILVMLAAIFVLQDKDSAIDTVDLFAPEVSDRLDEIHRVELRDGVNQLAIARNQTGDWLLEQSHNYYVDASRITTFLRSIASAKAVEEKTSKPEYYSRLGVEEVSPEGTSIEVALFWDAESKKMLFGNTQGSYRYAREFDQATSWLVDADLDLGTSASSWLDDELLNISESEVLEVSIEHSDGEIIKIVRGENTDYQLSELPEGRELKYASILNSIGGVLSGLSFEQLRPQAGDDMQATDTNIPTVDTLRADTTSEFKLSDGTRVIFRRYPDSQEEGDSWFRLDVVSADQQAPVLDAAAIEKLRRAIDGWEFQFASFKADQIAQRMENLLAAQE